MIENKGYQTELKFGEGDIHIVSCCTGDGLKGYVVFENQSPARLIGENPEGFNKEFIPEEYPVIMTFSKIESIDVLIGALLNAKDNMIRLSKGK